jgi:nicotinate-nucleotide adenylyltransferase
VKLGLFGGSFDPFHAGHLAVARTARRALGLDRVVVLPTGRPPHKPNHRLAPGLARYAMAELALLDDPDLVVSDGELRSDAPSYTIDTLGRFAAERPEASLHLLVGSDSLAGLHTWRRWEEILERATLAVVARPGAARSEVLAGMPPVLADRLATARLEWVECAPHPASGTEIRHRLRSGEAPPDGWLDPRVLTFLRKYRLYR